MTQPEPESREGVRRYGRPTGEGDTVSELLVVGFADEQHAQQVWDEFRPAENPLFDDFRDGAVVVHRKDQTFEVRAGHRLVTEGLS